MKKTLKRTFSMMIVFTMLTALIPCGLFAEELDAHDSVPYLHDIADAPSITDSDDFYNYITPHENVTPAAAPSLAVKLRQHIEYAMHLRDTTADNGMVTEPDIYFWATSDIHFEFASAIDDALLVLEDFELGMEVSQDMLEYALWDLQNAIENFLWNRFYTAKGSLAFELSNLISSAKFFITATNESADGRDIQLGLYWVTSQTMVAFMEEVKAAERVLDGFHRGNEVFQTLESAFNNFQGTIEEFRNERRFGTGELVATAAFTLAQGRERVLHLRHLNLQDGHNFDWNPITGLSPAAENWNEVQINHYGGITITVPIEQYGNWRGMDIVPILERPWWKDPWNWIDRTEENAVEIREGDRLSVRVRNTGENTNDIRVEAGSDSHEGMLMGSVSVSAGETRDITIWITHQHLSAAAHDSSEWAHNNFRIRGSEIGTTWEIVDILIDRVIPIPICEETEAAGNALHEAIMVLIPEAPLPYDYSTTQATALQNAINALNSEYPNINVSSTVNISGTDPHRLLNISVNFTVTDTIIPNTDPPHIPSINTIIAITDSRIPVATAEGNAAREAVLALIPEAPLPHNYSMTQAEEFKNAINDLSLEHPNVDISATFSISGTNPNNRRLNILIEFAITLGSNLPQVTIPPINTTVAIAAEGTPQPTPTTPPQPTPTAPATITVTQGFARQGETIQVGIRLDRNPGFAGMFLRVELPQGLTLVSYDVTDPELANGISMAQVGGGVNIAPKEIANITGTFFVGWVRNTDFTAQTGILMLNLAVASSAENGNLPISVTLANAVGDNIPTNADGDKLDITVRQGGGVTVRTEIINADANGDNRITSADGVIIARYIVGHVVTIDKEAADLNNDGKVDTLDLTILGRWLVGIEIPN